MILEFPQEGGRCWAVGRNGHPLPEGLADRSPVKVLEERKDKFLVEDAQGRRWTLPLTQLDAGHSYYLSGELRSETHPLAVQYLRHSLQEIEEGLRTSGENAWAWAERKDLVRWYLERNGFDPDAPVRGGDAGRFVDDLSGSPMRSDWPPRRLQSERDLVIEPANA